MEQIIASSLQFMAMLSAALLCLLFLLSGILYHKAYISMKKTKIIGSLAWLFYAISFKFFAVLLAFGALWVTGNSDIATFNAFNGVPNIILLVALLYFIEASISTPQETKKSLKKVDEKDIRKI
jgi:hypothetical protein